ncbi:protein cornichon homolog 4-like [Lineus longissimus]|uniref:protein cornichon homolog 4-like n=1 Tax=Lineus longissimus TaxID=88925 RepID=UPI002B4DB35F
MSDAGIFIFSLLDTASLLFLAVYFIVTLSDLECDYLNARECCSRLNRWILPEIIAQGIMTFLMFISLHWVLFLLNAPLTAWQIRKLYMKPSGYIGVYDPAEIHNRQLLKGYMKEAMVKLGWHLLFFFIFLYNMIVSLVGS